MQTWVHSVFYITSAKVVRFLQNFVNVILQVHDHVYTYLQETDHISRSYIKKSNRPKFADPRMSNHHPLFKTSVVLVHININLTNNNPITHSERVWMKNKEGIGEK